MNKRIILILIFMFSMSYVFGANTPLIMKETPTSDVKFEDLDLYGNIHDYYENRNFNLPYYMPSYLSQDLYLSNKTAGYNTVIGRYMPRYFDGEKYTNFRTEFYDPRNLTRLELFYLDKISLTVEPTKITNDKCNYVAIWNNAKGFTDTQEFQEGKTQFEIPYYYDLGFWYVPAIRSAFQADCKYIFNENRQVHPLSGNIAEYSYVDNTKGKILYDSYIQELCNGENSINGLQAVWSIIGSTYNATTPEELATKLYTITPANKMHDGDCEVNVPGLGITDVDCYSNAVLIEDRKIMDKWMYEVLAGTYLPKSTDLNNGIFQGKSMDDYLSQSDVRYRQCVENVLSFGSIFLNIFMLGSDNNNERLECEAYLQEKRKELLRTNDIWTSSKVQEVIWDHYKLTYNIPKGTNLYPLNVKYGALRCADSDDWTGTKYDPLNPNAETPYIECKYNNSDAEIVNVSYLFQIAINPAFALVAGSDSKFESYNTAYLRQAMAILRYNPSIVSIKEYGSYADVISSFSINRSKNDGCSFTFTTQEQLNTTMNVIDPLLSQVDHDAFKVAEELPKALKSQIQLLRSEEKKTQFYFYLDIVAKLIFRGFVLFYYILSIMMILWILRLIFILPGHIVKTMNNLGKSKQKRQQDSILMVK